MKQKAPVALFVTDADQTICRSQERYNTFCSTFLGSSISYSLPRGSAGAYPEAGSDGLVFKLRRIRLYAVPCFCGSGAAAPTILTTDL